MSPRRVVSIVAAVLGVLVVFVAGVMVGGHAQALGLTQLKDPLRGLLLGDSGEQLSKQVLEVLEDRYYVAIDSSALERASAQGIVDSLEDPYTDYLDPDELDALRQEQESLGYSGVGLQVAEKDSAIVVTSVYRDSPAGRAEILVGDRLVSVEGRPTKGRDLGAVVETIRGPEGTPVRIGVTTGSGPPRDLSLVRARIRVPSVASRVETVNGERIGYVRLVRFTRGSGRAVRDAVTRLRAKKVGGLVLDLRGDGGGLVTEAIGVAGVFLAKGATVVVTQGLHSPRRVFRTDSDPVAEELPLTVLVDRDSASASEIVAGALRDSVRARLIGERTFGKALVQNVVPLRDGGALKLTTARYLTPAGFNLAERGLPPDVKIADDPATPKDEVLQRGLALAAAG